MRRVVIHAGYPKAGSTAIQHYFHEHRERLAAAGVLYPKSGIPYFGGDWLECGHHNLSLSFDRNPQSARYEPERGGFAEILTEWNSTGADTLVVSSEDFIVPLASFASEFHRRIYEVFSGARVDLVFVVRNIVDYFESNLLQERVEWQLGLRQGIMRTHQEEIEALPSYSWYPEPVLAARKLFGEDRVHVIAYASDIVPRLFDFLGFDYFTSGIGSEESKKNTRLPAKLAKLLLNISTAPDGAELRQRLIDSGVAWDQIFQDDIPIYNLFSASAFQTISRVCSGLVDEFSFVPKADLTRYDECRIDLMSDIYSTEERMLVTELLGKDVMARAESEYLA